jgi:hypothetical protein
MKNLKWALKTYKKNYAKVSESTGIDPGRIRSRVNRWMKDPLLKQEDPELWLVVHS